MACGSLVFRSCSACIPLIFRLYSSLFGGAGVPSLGSLNTSAASPRTTQETANQHILPTGTDNSIAPPTCAPETWDVASASKPVFSVQVRELVEFALRQGDLGGGRDFAGRNRALAGTRGHQRLQRSRPAGYQKEVRLSHEIDAGECVLRVQGRIDGLLVSADEVLLEEIKTVKGGWDGVADPLHWAQAKLYGFIYAQANSLGQITIQLSYLDLDTGEVTELRNGFSLAELSAFFQEATGIYLDWLRAQCNWLRQRDKSIRALEFPFASYRPGQRQLAVAAYRVLAKGGRLFLEAPTGIGKTISVLFPAVKALAEGKLERIFYLTARTSGRAVAQKAHADLCRAGLRLRTLTLTAKEKICQGVRPFPGAASSEARLPTAVAAPGDGRTPAVPSNAPGQPCDTATCPFARGYYDRCKTAMRDALAREEITRSVLEAVAREHQVCPFELSLDLSSWVDVVVCDYNYVFDPKVYLRRHFSEEPGDYAFLVDEAHNLVDRAREMFSADLDTREIQDVRRALKQAAPRCAKALSRLTSTLRKLADAESLTMARVAQASQSAVSQVSKPATPSISGQPADLEVGDTAGLEACATGMAPAGHGDCSPELDLFPPEKRAIAPPNPDSTRPVQTIRAFPAPLAVPLEDALTEAEIWLARNEPADFRESLLQLFFQLHSFQRTAELYDEHYVTIIEPGRSIRVRLFCLDPSFLLRQALARGKAAVFFSATLTPIDYYRALLGGDEEDKLLQLPSPFPPQHLAVLVQDRIRTHFKARAGSLADVVEAIAVLVEGRRGNYLAYFPSYQYLTAVQEQFHALHPAVPILVQRPGMSEPEREAFLAAFAAEHGETLVGFAVMGGVFGEGIDLVGDRLIGAIIVGVGLPQLCVERDLIRDYFQGQTGAGFDYAYTFPGMNRVLQAIGRVIRSETDRGAVLLIDARFAEQRYRRLFPLWWQPTRVRSIENIREALRKFWQPSR
jgi:DNA excision repair protein ERCC-2